MKLPCSWCSSPVYLLYIKSCFPEHNKKKSTTKPAASIVHNNHILLFNTNLSSAMVSENKALCNNAGLQCSCSQAVNSIRELIWLKKILQQTPCYFLNRGKFANTIWKVPQHSWGNGNSITFGSLCCILTLWVRLDVPVNPGSKTIPCLQTALCLLCPSGMLLTAEGFRRGKEECQVPSNHKVANTREFHSVKSHVVSPGKQYSLFSI